MVNYHELNRNRSFGKRSLTWWCISRLKLQKSQLSYPEDLQSADQGHYVQFFINEQENANISFSGGSPSSAGGTSYGGGGGTSTLSVKRAPTKRISSSIALYMPAQVSLQQDAKYGEVEIGAATATAIAAYKGFQDQGDFSANAVSSMGAFGEVAKEHLVQRH